MTVKTANCRLFVKSVLSARQKYFQRRVQKPGTTPPSFQRHLDQVLRRYWVSKKKTRHHSWAIIIISGIYSADLHKNSRWSTLTKVNIMEIIYDGFKVSTATRTHRSTGLNIFYISTVVNKSRQITNYNACAFVRHKVTNYIATYSKRTWLIIWRIVCFKLGLIEDKTFKCCIKLTFNVSGKSNLKIFNHLKLYHIFQLTTLFADVLNRQRFFRVGSGDLNGTWLHFRFLYMSGFSCIKII